MVDLNIVCLTLAEFDAADPALIDDLILLAHLDNVYRRRARDAQPDPDARFQHLARMARPWNR